MSDNLQRLGCCPGDPAPQNCNSGPDLCSPPQPLPPSMSSFAVSPDNVLIYHSCDGALLDRCMGSGVESLTEWMGWVENTIIAPFCMAKENPCTVMQAVKGTDGSVSIQSVAIGKVIADCLGMSVAKPHVIYNATSKTAVAGKIEPEAMSCTQFNKFMVNCPIIAPAGTVPTHILGYDPIPMKDPKWYEFKPTTPMKFVAAFSNADSFNNFPGVSANQRIIPRRSTERYHIVESSAFDGELTKLDVGVNGLYQFDYSIMLNVQYQALMGWVVDVMTGLLISPADGSGDYEIRTDERPMYLNYTAAAGQDIILQGNTAIDLKAGDSVTPRVWFNNTYVPSGTQDRRLQIWINRSAQCLFSAYRMPDGEVTIGT